MATRLRGSQVALGLIVVAALGVLAFFLVGKGPGSEDPDPPRGVHGKSGKPPEHGAASPGDGNREDPERAVRNPPDGNGNSWLTDFEKLVGDLKRPDVSGLTEEVLSSWEIPDYLLMSRPQRVQLRKMMSIIGDSVHLPATVRFSFMTKHMPASTLDNVADDMMRFLPREELDSVIALIDEIPASEAKNELYRLACQRLVRLETPREEIEKWIATLEHEDEREWAKYSLP